MKLTFRDGEREIPDHLVVQMNKAETPYMTVDEAIAKVNADMQKRVIDAEFDKIIADHMARLK